MGEQEQGSTTLQAPDESASLRRQSGELLRSWWMLACSTDCAWSSRPGRKLGAAGVSGIQRLEHIVAKRREHVNMCFGGRGTNPWAPMQTFFFFSKEEGELF